MLQWQQGLQFPRIYWNINRQHRFLTTWCYKQLKKCFKYLCLWHTRSYFCFLVDGGTSKFAPTRFQFSLPPNKGSGMHWQQWHYIFVFLYNLKQTGEWCTVKTKDTSCLSGWALPLYLESIWIWLLFMLIKKKLICMCLVESFVCSLVCFLAFTVPVESAI